MFKKCTVTLVLLLLAQASWALGLRTFVAVPVAKGDWILRALNANNFDSKVNVQEFAAVYGLDNRNTFFVIQPTRLHPSGPNRTGDLNLLYRYTLFTNDRENGTTRLGVLAGGLIATSSNSNGGAQAGLVGTHFSGRNEIDADVIYKEGFGRSLNTTRYDLSWQYRIFPSEYPDDDLPSSWNTVLEYNGRWIETTHLVHQVTAGLQWVHPTWIIEGGLFKDINTPHNLGLITSFRLHI